MSKRILFSMCIKLKVFKILFCFFGISYRKPETEEDLHSIFRMRHDTYVETGYIKPHESGLYEDQYDKNSVFIMCFKKGEHIASGRLILNTGFGLQTVHMFNIGKPTHQDVAEISGLMIQKKYRGKKLIPIGLMTCLYKELAERHIKQVYFSTKEKLAEHYKKFGMVFVEVETLPEDEETLNFRSGSTVNFSEGIFKPYIMDVDENKKIFGLH